MDLLAGYGSDVSGEQVGDAEDVRPTLTATSVAGSIRDVSGVPADFFSSNVQSNEQAYLHDNAVSRVKDGASVARFDYGSSVPAASSMLSGISQHEVVSAESNGSKLFSSLPMPRVSGGAAGRLVQFKVPFKLSAGRLDTDEEEPPKKRRKGKLFDLLPPPKNEAMLAAGSSKRVDTGGNDAATVATDEAVIVDPPADVSHSDASVAQTNELYAVDESGLYGQDVGSAVGYQYDVPDHGSTAGWVACQSHHHQLHGDSSEVNGTPAAHSSSAPDHILEAALRAEQEKAKRQGRGIDLGGVQFKEVNQEQLKYVNPSARAEMNSVRTAFGHDYEAKLRGQAGAAPDKLARRKHQIGSLYHYAKNKELEMFEKRGQSMKTKAETQAKYGW